MRLTLSCLILTCVAALALAADPTPAGKTHRTGPIAQTQPAVGWKWNVAIAPEYAIAADVCSGVSPVSIGPEQTIKDRSKDFDAAWNKHDAQAVAAYYTTDGDIVTDDRNALSGRDGIQQALTDAFGGQLKDSVLKTTVSTVRLIKPDVAIVDAEAEIKTGDADARKLHLVSVLVNKDGKWLTETTRAIVYRQP